MIYSGDPVSLREKLAASAAEWPLAAEALARIETLESLCARMTDTGVILEEDAQVLSEADTWWLPEEPENCYSSLEEALTDITFPGSILELARSHTLPNCWAVLLPEIRDQSGRVVLERKAAEFFSYSEAEEACATYELTRRRVEYGV